MQFSGLAALSFSTDRSYKLLGRQLWAVLSRSPATVLLSVTLGGEPNVALRLAFKMPKTEIIIIIIIIIEFT